MISSPPLVLSCSVTWASDLTSPGLTFLIRNGNTDSNKLRQVWGGFSEPKSSPGKFCVFLYYFLLQVPLWCPARQGVLMALCPRP